jgi:hypothetical protein
MFPRLNGDGFVKSPTSALRFISLSLRRTTSTPRDTRLARLEFGAFYKVVCKSSFYEHINGAQQNISAELKRSQRPLKIPCSKLQGIFDRKDF